MDANSAAAGRFSGFERWLDRVIAVQGAVPSFVAVGSLSAGLGLCFFVTYLFGGAASFAPS